MALLAAVHRRFRRSIRASTLPAGRTHISRRLGIPTLLTTGLALQENAGVDDAVFFGSPGLGTNNSDNLRVTGQLYYIEAKNDFIGDLGVFGTDPSYFDHVRQASSEETTLPDGRHLVGIEGHSAYFTEKSTSQYNMACVVGGLPDHVVEE